MKKGFALIEMLVGVFILVTVGLAIAGAFVSAVKSVAYTKTVIAATALANSEMETLHNLPYNSLATRDGIVPKPDPYLTDIPDDKTVDYEGITFSVRTVIKYYDDPADGTDDPADGTPLAGTDIAPIDYKKIAVSVGLPGKPFLTTLATNIGSKAAETPTDTGILKVCVIDSRGSHVDDATVTLTNSNIPGFGSKSGDTESGTGCVKFYVLQEETQNNYHVEVTKLGYSKDWTYGGQGRGNAQAPQPDQNIDIQTVTRLILNIDRVSSLQIQFTDTLGVAIPDVTFTLTGTKLIHNAPPTLKYPPTLFAAGVDGKKTISPLEFDTYSITGLGSYTLVSPANPIVLSPNTTLPVTVILQ